MSTKFDFEEVVRYFIDPVWTLVWPDKPVHIPCHETLYATQEDWNQTLMTKINQCSAQISKASHNNLVNPFVQGGGAAMVITSPEVYQKYLLTLLYFDGATYEEYLIKQKEVEENPNHYGHLLGFLKVGTMSARYTVYVHKECSKDRIFVINPNFARYGGQVLLCHLT